MKRMLDDEQIFELQELLEQVSISDNGVVNINKVHTDELLISDTGKWDGEGIEAPTIKLGNFVGLTHSFAELDETLQTLVQSAIDDGAENGVACSEAQWNLIKALLDKSLFVNYQGYSLIKTATDGIASYLFGSNLVSNAAYSGVFHLEFNYDAENTTLYGLKDEI